MEPSPISIAMVCSVVPTPSASVSVIILNGIPATSAMINADDIIAMNGCIFTLIIKNNNTANPRRAPMISRSGEAVKSLIVLPPEISFFSFSYLFYSVLILLHPAPLLNVTTI